MEEGGSNDAAVIAKEEEHTGGFKYIPEEIVLNLLPNLPARSLLRFRCVSKQWPRLISSGLTQVPKVIIPRIHRVYQLVDQNTKLEDVEIEVDHPNVVPFIYGSCNEVLLIGIGINLFLWRPSTLRSHGMLTCGLLTKYPRGEVLPGLCFDWHNNDYKVVLGLNHRDLSERSVQVGSFKNKSWSTVDFSYNVGDFELGPTLHNYPHWWSKDEILYFDPKIDNFTKISPPEQNRYHEDICGLGVLDGCLCMARHRKPHTRIRVYGMKKYDEKDTWEIMFTFYNDNNNVVDRWVNFAHMTPLFYTDEQKRRVLIHVRRTEYEPHYYQLSPVKVSDEYAIVEYDVDEHVCTDIVVSNVKKHLHYDGPFLYEETSVRPNLRMNASSTNNSLNTGKVPRGGRQVWKVKENAKVEEKGEAPRKARGKKSATMSSMSNAFNLLNQDE